MAGTSFDVVVTDLMMPGMDGLELMQHLHNTGNEARVIMLTGYPTVQTALKANRLGAFEYVTKPFTRQELLSVVFGALRRGTTEAEAVGSSPLSAEQAEKTYFIREHSWARLEPDGSARIGMARAFASTVGIAVDLEFPSEGDLVEQGRMFVVVRADDGVEHHLHSPLSGKVLEINKTAMENAALALQDPEGEGWLLRLGPQNLKREVENLELAQS